MIYERGAFTSADTAMTAEALCCYTVGMLFMAVNEVLTKTFFADGRTLPPMITSLISMTVNVTAVIVLSPILGIGGIALLSGIATALNCTLNYLIMKKSRKLLSGRDWLDIFRSLLCAAVMGAAIFALMRLAPDMSGIVTLIAGIAVGASVYFILALLLRSDEIRLLKNVILKKTKNGETND